MNIFVDMYMEKLNAADRNVKNASQSCFKITKQHRETPMENDVCYI